MTKPDLSHQADDALTRLVTTYGRPALPVAVLLAAVVLGILRGWGGAILALAGGMLLVVITLLWRSLQVLVGEAELPADVALGMGVDPEGTEQKRAILQAIKELDYERSIGKIGDEDYRVLSSRYRAEAKDIMRRLDATLAPARARAEEVIAAHLRGDDAAPKPKKKRKRSAESNDANVEAVIEATAAATAFEPVAATSEPQHDSPEPTRAANTPNAASALLRDSLEPVVGGRASTTSMDGAASLACSACGVANDVDAVFCKKCGARVAGASEEGA